MNTTPLKRAPSSCLRRFACAGPLLSGPALLLSRRLRRGLLAEAAHPAVPRAADAARVLLALPRLRLDGSPLLLALQAAVSAMARAPDAPWVTLALRERRLRLR